MNISWNKTQRDYFADQWPCCDIPAKCWAVFDDGDLVDISPNARNCEPSGGISEFLDDLACVASKVLDDQEIQR